MYRNTHKIRDSCQFEGQEIYHIQQDVSLKLSFVALQTLLELDNK